MARQEGVSGWHSMKKEELVKALVRKSRAKSSASRKSNGSSQSRSKKSLRESVVKAKPAPSRRAPAATNGKKEGANGTRKPAKRTSVKTLKKIQSVNAERDRLKDLSSSTPDSSDCSGRGNGSSGRDRIVLLVRDSYWLQASWEINRQSVERIRAAMAELWHTARPTLRLIEVDDGVTTSTAERVAREVPVHGGVNNWYIDVQDPPKSYRVDIGYKSDNGRFIALARSNSVTTPRPGSSDALDENWTDVAKDYERIYSMSGGLSGQSSSDDLKELFEERLRRPMGSPLVTKYGVGADVSAFRRRAFGLEVDAELIIYGQTRPDGHVTLAGQPVKLRADGTFTVRRQMPDRREVLPVVASSSDGLEQRTTILAIERNTKVMEPVKREPTDQHEP
jgi:hypothetical protein